MSRQDRLSQILEIVVEKGSVDVEFVANTLKVSAATIRVECIFEIGQYVR